MDISTLFTCLSKDEKDILLDLLLSEKKVTLNNLINIDDWIDSNPKLPKMSTRLKNVLLSGDGNGLRRFTYLHQVYERNFFQVRDAGKISWNEFLYYRDHL